jgi:hypothetical protein
MLTVYFPVSWHPDLLNTEGSVLPTPCMASNGSQQIPDVECIARTTFHDAYATKNFGRTANAWTDG